jgi:hypothetical protein
MENISMFSKRIFNEKIKKSKAALLVGAVPFVLSNSKADQLIFGGFEAGVKRHLTYNLQVS